MTTNLKRRARLIASAMIIAGCAGPALAAESGGGPRPVHEGKAIYVSGGIGADEEHALEAEAKEYNLQVSNATKSGGFITDADFEIKSKDGRHLFRANDAGPLFFAHLPAGEYILRASNRGQQRVEKIKVSDRKPTQLHLIWQPS